MTYIKYIVFIIMFTLFSIPATIFAATIPLANVPIYLKSFSTSRYSFSNTDANGFFTVNVLEASGAYNMFINDQTMPAIKMTAKDGVITGQVVVLTDGTTTQDPAPIKPVKKVTPVSATKSTIKKVTATSTATKKTN